MYAATGDQTLNGGTADPPSWRRPWAYIQGRLTVFISLLYQKI